MTRVAWIAVAGLLWLCPTGTLAADDVRGAIEAANRDFVAAFARGDARAVAALYTTDGQVLPPGGGRAAGREAIAAFWQAAMDDGARVGALETGEVESAGDLAYEVGQVELLTADGTVAQSRYLVVWKREDGGWKLHRDMWQ